MPRAKPGVVPLRETVREAKVYETITIKLLFDCGGAVFRVDEDIGSLTVDSDWGTYSYVWGHGGRNGRSLLDFLRTCSDGYMASKLLSGRREEVFDVPAMRREMKAHARTLFKQDRLRFAVDDPAWASGTRGNSFELFRELTSEIMEFCREIDDIPTTHDIYPYAGELMGKVFDPLWDFIKTELPDRHQFLHDQLIPTFQAYLRGELYGLTPPTSRPSVPAPEPGG